MITILFIIFIQVPMKDLEIILSTNRSSRKQSHSTTKTINRQTKIRIINEKLVPKLSDSLMRN